MIRYHGTRGITLWWTFWLLAAPARLARWAWNLVRPR
jgi:hypothetical protein